MLVMRFFLDGLTLFFLFAYALSAVVALLPNITATSPHQQVCEARRRLLLPPVGAIVLVGIGLWPFDLQTHTWLHLAKGETVHDLAALGVLTAWVSLLLWHAYSWGKARGYLNLLGLLTAPEQAETLRQSLAGAGLAWPGVLQVIDCKLPLCFVLGRSRLVLSTLLLEELSPKQLQAIVAHELAHVTHQDNVWRLVLQGTRLAHLPGLGQRAFQYWAQSTELVCDEAAAKKVGALCVAETLVCYQRLINRAGPWSMELGPAFYSSFSFQARVERLLATAPPVQPGWWLVYWPLGLLLLVLAQAGSLHVLFEQLLELLHA